MRAEPSGVPDPGDRLPAAALEVVRARTGLEPVAGIVLGSGLRGVADHVAEGASFGFDELPGFPAPTVAGHAGRLVLGHLSGTPVAVFLGRIHHYEGHGMSGPALPVRVAHALGARTMVLTASVGALDEALGIGTIVVADDHINLMGENPLRGWRLADGTPAFVDLSAVYDRELGDLAETRARELGLAVARGVYAAVSGPSYETPAEVEFLRRAGGVVVGMSVVPEAVPACALGMRVLGLFSVANTVGVQVSHTDVLRASSEAAEGIGRLLAEIAPRLA